MRDNEFLKRVYCVYVKPTLKYASSVWRSSSISLNAAIEKVKRRYTERMNGLKNFSYERRRSVLSLQNLTKSLQYNDLALTYKCLHGLLAVTHESVGLRLLLAPTRAEGLRLVHYKSKSHLLSQCFQSRIPPLWNSLSDAVVSCRTLGIFKLALMKYFRANINFALTTYCTHCSCLN